MECYEASFIQVSVLGIKFIEEYVLREKVVSQKL